MKGVSYIVNQKGRKKAVIIEFDALQNYTGDLIDHLHGLIAESRKYDEKVPLAKVISNLKKSGKL